LTAVVTAQASADFPSGDISKFVQGISVVQGYTENTNRLINSAVNSQTYLGGTFTGTSNSITGDITQVSTDTEAFGIDLANLGKLIDLQDLGNLGSPFALVQRIIAVVGNVPVLSVAFLAEGVPQNTVLNITNPTISVTDTIQKLMYRAMTKITGTDLAQILKVLKVTTAGITTMADLLNPLKLFPNSFQTLTVTTPGGSKNIYTTSSGSVNATLVADLPPYVISATGFPVTGVFP
jgi:hypothetical protein